MPLLPCHGVQTWLRPSRTGRVLSLSPLCVHAERHIGWFTELSAKFLGVRTAKLLVLAGTDRLDKPMMIGQMQGARSALASYVKGLMSRRQVPARRLPGRRPLPARGPCRLRSIAITHAVQDAPERLAQTVIDFWRRNDTVDILRNVKKVGAG